MILICSFSLFISNRNVSVSAVIACLDGPYRSNPGMSITLWPVTLLMWIMWPSVLFAIMFWIACLVAMHSPNTFVSKMFIRWNPSESVGYFRSFLKILPKIVFHDFGSPVINDPVWERPALLTKTLIGPSLATICLNVETISSSLVMSHLKAINFPLAPANFWAWDSITSTLLPKPATWRLYFNYYDLIDHKFQIFCLKTSGICG